MNVVEALESQVDATKHVHCLLRSAGRVTIATLYAALYHRRLQPDVMIEVEHAEVIKCHLTVPPTKNVHVVLIYHGCVTKPDLRLWQKLERLWDDSLVHHVLVFFRVHFDFLALNVEPTVRADMIAVQVREDVSLVATTIHIELVEVPDERVVSSGLRCVSRIQIDPLLLNSLKLC